MDPTFIQQARNVFLAALDVPTSERAAFVAHRCGDDGALRDRVVALLRHSEDDNAADPVAPAARHAEPTGVGVVLGDYVLQRELGHGGMGVVWLAEQKSLDRTVALKLVRQSFASPELLRRLEREATILGRLQHPGIANVYAVGSAQLGPGGSGGTQHFFAMEYVQGEPIDAYADRLGLDPTARLELIAQVCDAVEHAHQRGVIHRDLKPDNILVTADGQPKVLDFGIARATSSDVMAMTMQTAVGQVVGTVPYMSPEQVLGDSTRIDVRSDVYALGVLLYQLLGRRLPTDVHGLSIPEAARRIRDDEPTRLGTVATGCRGDVETIVHKALEKDPERRYKSVGALAADLRRHLRNEPIVARPTTTLYQLRKFARRHTGLVVGLGLAFATLVVGTVVSAVFAVRAGRTAAAFEREAYAHGLMVAASALRENDVTLAEEALRHAPERLRGWAWRHLASRVDMSLLALPLGDGVTRVLGQPWFAADVRIVHQWVGRFDRDVAQSGRVTLERWRLPDGERLEPAATLAMDRAGDDSVDVVNVWPGWGRLDGEWLEWFRPDSAEPVRLPWAEFPKGDRWQGNLCFTPTGSHAAWSSAADGATVMDNVAWFAEIRDGHVAAVRRLGKGIPRWISPDGSRVMLQTDERGGLLLASAAGDAVPLRGHSQTVGACGSADGSLLATGSWDGTVRTWNARTGAPIAVTPQLGSVVRSCTLHPDGRLFASGTNDGLLHVWEVPELRLRTILRGHRNKGPWCLSLSHDGSLLASISSPSHQWLRVWDTAVDAEPWALRGHGTYVYGLAVSPDGRRIASGGWDDTVRLWDARTLLPTATLTGHRDWVGAVAFSPDGAHLASVGAVRRLLVWDVATGAQRAELAGYGLDPMMPITWHPDSGHLLVGFDDKAPRVFDWRSNSVETVAPERLREFRSGVVGPDGGRYLIAHPLAAEGPCLALHETGSGAELARVRTDIAGGKFAFSPPVVGPARLLVAYADANRDRRDAPSGWCLLDARTGAVLAQRSVGRTHTLAVAFSPDGSRFVTGGYDNSISVWDAEHLDELVRLSGHTDYVFRLAFGPDGERLYSASGDGTVRVWSTQPLAEVLRARRER